MDQLVVALATAVVALAGVVAPFAAADRVPASRPNIVMFYIDDAAPHDGRLWSNPSLTPHIYDQFIAHGVHFPNAIGENALCCPARGNVLTGLHTHNNRVITNNAQLFDPSVTIGKSMLHAGYATMWLGKYLNRDNTLTPEQWAQHDAGWTDLDVMSGINGSFYGYTLHTKKGDLQVKGVHSTQMVGDRAVMHFKETPSNQPIFAVLSIFNLHSPNVPLPEFKDDPRCANMPPWDPPNYNEADVSDKPPGIASLPLQPYTGGWPMVGYCREMLGIDKIVGMVTNELSAEGRLDNTLLVFTADNGMAWGQHRLGQQKIWPYATPVPLYMRWPAAHWGDTPATIPEIVSNIDYAPTFCDLAGPSCVLGPFARGNTQPDGVTIAPLVRGDASNLGRDAVLEESYIPGGVNWAGLRTTAVFDPNVRWHYIEYTDGFRELYDLTTDPWELQNIATAPENAALVATLHSRLGQLEVEGITSGSGSLTVVQDSTIAAASDDVTFSGDLGDFTLDDDADPTFPNSQTWSGLPSGRYTIVRHGATSPTSINCTGVFTSDAGSQTMTVFVHPQETISCIFSDPPSVPPGRPDLSAALALDGAYKGDNIYRAVPVRAQTIRRTNVPLRRARWFWVNAQNDSAAIDSLTLAATQAGSSTASVSYFLNDADITSAITSGAFSSGDLESGESLTIGVRVVLHRGTPVGATVTVLVTAASGSDPSVTDVNRLQETR